MIFKICECMTFFTVVMGFHSQLYACNTLEDVKHDTSPQITGQSSIDDCGNRASKIKKLSEYDCFYNKFRLFAPVLLTRDEITLSKINDLNTSASVVKNFQPVPSLIKKCNDQNDDITFDQLKSTLSSLFLPVIYYVPEASFLILKDTRRQFLNLLKDIENENYFTQIIDLQSVKVPFLNSVKILDDYCDSQTPKIRKSYQNTTNILRSLFKPQAPCPTLKKFYFLLNDFYNDLEQVRNSITTSYNLPDCQNCYDKTLMPTTFLGEELLICSQCNREEFL